MIRFQTVRAIYGGAGIRGCEWVPQYMVCDGAKEEELLLGYELIAGLSILYVDTRVFAQGVQMGLIVPPAETLPRMCFKEVWHTSGLERCETLRQALLDATPELLERTLKWAKPLAEKWIRIQVFDAFHERRIERETGKPSKPYLMEELLLDPVTAQVSERWTAPEEQRLEQCYFRCFHPEMGYVECIERLAERAYRHFQNVEDLLSVYAENSFHDMDRFCQRLLRLNFALIKRQDQGERSGDCVGAEPETGRDKGPLG